MIFFIFFSKNLRYEKIEPNLKFSTEYWVAVKVHSRVENLASKYECLNPFGFRDMAFYDFFIFFSRKLRYKKNNRTSISQLYSGLLSRYIHRLQIWRSIMTAQIFFCSRYGVFYVFFMFFFQKKLEIKK